MVRRAQPMTEEEKAWTCGFAAALGGLLFLFDQPSMARDIMASDAVRFADLRRAGVAEYDLKKLLKAIPPAERRRYGL